MQILEHVLHLQGRFHQQATQTDGIGLVLLSGSNDGVGGLLDAQVHHLVAVVAEDDIHQILADIVHVTLDGGQHNDALLGASRFFQLGFQISNRLFHHRSGIEHRRKLHLAGAEELADGFHGVEQDIVDEIERRVFAQR